ncbi:DUF1120 domain-containing protein [Pseudomonas fluorescens]|uniref:DUF1120 domain-containing protein n=1 Tax=Pseudomonas fluorescens group TaxID=136843 RepID=UPI0015E75277|nr:MULTISPECIES: DUF1120 domain-containing protein [Pseudomonas fluorescens group]MBA1428401.1 DUF1120 domain-containing protein [Pseudomonas orientalis]MBD8147128.1 DUF1120 domain-containing protein [Pseudomonas fluorescens]MBD8175600.1 DUF1120 domain-containing protein [Pseudomonas fluorescens]MBD8744055.1 DUF1120 domain-containing protein [Pseudomonas fluorescens]MBD8750331.1 DUF1120 domain-containing protein [Pseudomonas fluorescens]
MAAHPLNTDRHGRHPVLPVLTAWGRSVTIVLGLTAMIEAHAASAVDLTVTGRVTPDACHVELSHDGTVDHGRIASHSLNADEFTVLPVQTLGLRVQCARPMLFALVGIDERADSSSAPDYFYGLGRNIHVPEERLGSVALAYRNAVGDAQAMQVLASRDNGESWSQEPNAYPRAYMAFAPAGDRQPDFISQLIVQLQVSTAINFSRYLTLDQEVPLDGAIVLDLRYL